MNIYDAIKARTADKPFITRRSWTEEYGPWAIYGIRILPTNTPSGCMMQSRLRGTEKTPASRWQPVAGDLVAEDWEISD